MLSPQDLRQKIVEELHKSSESMDTGELYEKVGGLKSVGLSKEAFGDFVKSCLSPVSAMPNTAEVEASGDENASPRYALQTGSLNRKKMRGNRVNRSYSQSSRATLPDGSLKRFNPTTDGFRTFFQLMRRLTLKSRDGSIAWNEIRNAYRKETGRHLNSDELNSMCGTVNLTRHDLLSSVLCNFVQPVDSKCLVIRMAELKPGKPISTPSPIAARSQAASSQASPEPTPGQLSPTVVHDRKESNDSESTNGAAENNSGESSVDLTENREAMKRNLVEQLRRRGIVLSADGRRIESDSSGGMSDGPLPYVNGSTTSSVNEKQQDEDEGEDMIVDPVGNDDVFPVEEEATADSTTAGDVNREVVDEKKDESLLSPPAVGSVETDERYAKDCCGASGVFLGSDMSDGQVTNRSLLHSDREESQLSPVKQANASVDSQGDAGTKESFLSMSVHDESSVSSSMNAGFLASDSRFLSFSSIPDGAGPAMSETSGEQGYTTGNEQADLSSENCDVSLDLSLDANGTEPPTPRRTHEITLCSSRNDMGVTHMPHPDISPLSSANSSQIAEATPQKSLKTGVPSHSSSGIVASLVRDIETHSTAPVLISPISDAIGGSVGRSQSGASHGSTTTVCVNAEFVRAPAESSASTVTICTDVAEDVITVVERSVTIAKEGGAEMKDTDGQSDHEDIPYDDGLTQDEASQPTTPSKLEEVAKDKKAAEVDDLPTKLDISDDGEVRQTMESVKEFLNDVEKSEQAGIAVLKREEEMESAEPVAKNRTTDLEPIPEVDAEPVTEDTQVEDGDKKDKKKKKRVRVVVPPRRRIIGCCTIL